METKRFKDPIYGYIEVDCNYVKDIIDTPEFQRLKRIVQTSYSPLYSNSLHNRFVHSIGVYYLGKIAVNSIIFSLGEVDESFLPKDLDSIKSTFLLACLLHDVGHAPFSHTGESFFLHNEEGSEDKKYLKLHKKLIENVGSQELEADLPADSKAAAPHEIMSAIVAINKYPKFFFDTFDKEFFARCITGYKYRYTENDEYEKKKRASLLNCFISCLNSKVIDVDRLDYLIRDAYFSGFESINIDYTRLLTSMRIISDQQKQEYNICYLKNAISIIENVVYAHDSERKWIQTHPIVLYDMYIIQHIMHIINDEVSTPDCKLFSYEALSYEGVKLNKDIHISLLTDDDIIYLLKSLETDELSKEYFNRNYRHHPLWKSEAEFKAFFSVKLGNGQIYQDLLQALEKTANYVKSNSNSGVVNASLMCKLNEELSSLQKNEGQFKNPENYYAQIKSKKAINKIFKCLKKFSDKNNTEFDYIILEANQFYSNFNKDDFSKIKIKFPQVDSLYNFGEIIATLGSKRENEKFYYLYFKETSGMKINRVELCNELVKAFISD